MKGERISLGNLQERCDKNGLTLQFVSAEFLGEELGGYMVFREDGNLVECFICKDVISDVGGLSGEVEKVDNFNF